jgi:hypothetical protein
MFSRGLMESFKQGAAFGSEAVFLQAAVGFFGDGALDEVGGEGGLEIASFKVFAFTQGQSDPANPKLHHSNFTLFLIMAEMLGMVKRELKSCQRSVV